MIDITIVELLRARAAMEDPAGDCKLLLSAATEIEQLWEAVSQVKRLAAGDCHFIPSDRCDAIRLFCDSVLDRVIPPVPYTQRGWCRWDS